MPPRPPRLLLLHRTLHTSRPLLLRDRPTSSPHPQQPDDYYALLLSTPTPNLSPKKRPNPASVTNASTNPSVSISPPPNTTKSSNKPTAVKPSEPRVLFSTPLAGPSARMRGIARGEKGLGRPPEPENCCMSGCVNCVWDAYREEVEEWAATRQRVRNEGGRAAKTRAGGGYGDDGGGVGDLDKVGGLGVDVVDEGLFRELPVGIREFMSLEKRLRERRGDAGG